MTNRDLYLFVAGLVQRKQGSARSLEEYLRCFLRLASDHREASGIDGAAFAAILEAAFDRPVDEHEPELAGARGFAELVELVRRQIRDLREMEEAGTLGNEMRYFGANAPSGERWYNFDPCTYIECAVAGTFRGWREGDATSRTYVPGAVAVLGEDGSVEAVDPRDIDDPVEELGVIPWERVIRFVHLGQIYE